MAARRELALGGLAWLHVLCWGKQIPHSQSQLPSIPPESKNGVMTMERSTCYGPKELRCSNPEHIAADWLLSLKQSGSVRAVGEDAIVKQKRGSESQGENKT